MTNKLHTPSVDELLDISMRESWTNDNVSGSTRERSVRRVVEDWNMGKRKDNWNTRIAELKEANEK